LTELSETLKRVSALHPRSIDLHLERIERLLEAMGRPQDRLPPVIHVAGTNGKGSVVAFLRAMLEAGGYTVHAFTSPHLVRFTERIRLGGALVEEQRLVAALRRCEAINRGEQITYFEFTTAAALDLFASDPADYLLLEVGLGGRYDATNVVDSPLGTVITPISVDHVRFFGNRLAGIAHEKTGILKHGAPAVIGVQPDEVMEVVHKDCAALGIEPFVAGTDYDGYEQGGRLVYSDLSGLEDLSLPRLVGAHQIANAATAVAAARHFNLPLTSANFGAGMRNVVWPARMMQLPGLLAELLPDGAELWLDGGHNEAGALAIRRTFEGLNKNRSRPVSIIAGMMASKEAASYFAALAPLAGRVYCVPIAGEAGAFTAADLVTEATNGGLNAVAAASVRDALTEIAQRPAHRVLICGSLYLAGQVLAANGTPPV
jgi:dihydrofolate synthase / folylpolyglutamate synthase